jgi:hypothetical protein
MTRTSAFLNQVGAASGTGRSIINPPAERERVAIGLLNVD